MRYLISCVFSTFLFLGLTVSPAKAGETLTVYTYESFVSDWGPGPAIKKSFEAECDCQVNWGGIQDGVAILNRLKLEGASSAADLVLGLDTNLTAEARDTGLFADHGVSVRDLALPIEWQDDVFVPYDFAHFAMVYDRDKVANPPASLKELVEGDSRYKIVIQDPRTSTPGLGLLLWVKSVYGDKAADAWAKLKLKVLTVTPGWSEAYGLFTKGETEMVLSYTTSPAYHQIAEQSQKYAAASFAEGHYLQVEVAAMLKGAANPKLAQRFLAFMTGPGFQDHIALNNWMFPAGKTSEPLPAEFGKLVKPVKTFLYSSEDVSANRRAWTDEWLDVMSQ
ncbi:MAG: thiamine ABC transporter substrate binding subunit [Rhodospirillales bacterium]|nr:thiamine ABC transporter substrate binding subunit [Rhodospirillales bacterium]